MQLYAFDVLALDGDDLRKLPLHLRKTNRAPLAGAPDRWHPLCPIRTWRDRAPRHGLEAAGQPVPRWPVTGLDKGKKLRFSGYERGEGYVLRFGMAGPRRRAILYSILAALALWALLTSAFVPIELW